MPIAMKTKLNADDVIASLEAKGRRLSDVVRFAVNDTVDDMIVSERVEMRKVFDNPRPYTLNALYPRYAGKRGNILQAGIAFREYGVKGTPAYKYLTPQINGGPRGMKRSEKALQSLGILGTNYQTVQGRNFEKDQYGDIPGGQYTRMLAELGVQGVGLGGPKAQRKARTKGDRQFFLMRRRSDDRPFAIAEKRGDQAVIMLVFTGMASYKPRYDFYGVARKQVQMSFPKHVNRVFSRMMGGGGSAAPSISMAA